MRHPAVRFVTGIVLVLVSLAWQVVRFREPIRSWLADSPVSFALQLAGWAALLGGAWLIANAAMHRRRAADGEVGGGELADCD